jgi:hypothetical protein
MGLGLFIAIPLLTLAEILGLYYLSSRLWFFPMAGQSILTGVVWDNVLSPAAFMAFSVFSFCSAAYFCCGGLLILIGPRRYDYTLGLWGMFAPWNERKLTVYLVISLCFSAIMVFTMERSRYVIGDSVIVDRAWPLGKLHVHQWQDLREIDISCYRYRSGAQEDFQLFFKDGDQFTTASLTKFPNDEFHHEIGEENVAVVRHISNVSANIAVNWDKNYCPKSDYLYLLSARNRQVSYQRLTGSTPKS